MDPLPPPLAFFCLLFAGWVNRQQQAVIDYLLEENRVLRVAHGSRRLLLTDDQRQRLAVKGKVLGRRRIAPIARNTIKGILKDHGIEPAPQRGANMPWKTFLAAHWDGLAAADFFTVEVLTLRGLVRYVVLFVMKLKTRTVEIAGMTAQPDETWMMQVARNLTAAGDGFLRRTSHIILDRDPLYTTACRRLLRGGGVTPLVLPAWSPNLNAFAERFVGSVKSECLDRMVLLGERHLQAAVREFVGHYHEERPHQGLTNELIAPQTTVIGTGQVQCRKRLGSLLKF